MAEEKLVSQKGHSKGWDMEKGNLSCVYIFKYVRYNVPGMVGYFYWGKRSGVSP